MGIFKHMILFKIQMPWSKFIYIIYIFKTMFFDLAEQHIDAIILENPLAEHYTTLYCNTSITNDILH